MATESTDGHGELSKLSIGEYLVSVKWGVLAFAAFFAFSVAVSTWPGAGKWKTPFHIKGIPGWRLTLLI